MKQTKLILAAAILALLFAGCGGNGPGGDSTGTGSKEPEIEKRIPTTEELTVEAPEPTDTNLENAFDEILTNKNWGKQNLKALSYDSTTGIYTFDARFQTACIKRKITLSEKKRITYKIKPFLYEKYDGYLQFLIDDKVVAQYTGENTDWTYEQFELETGSHTIEWRRYDEVSGYTNFGNKEIIPKVELTAFAFKDALQALTSITQDFEGSLVSEMWSPAGLSSEIIERDPVFAKWTQYGDALIDTHGKVYRLSSAIVAGKDNKGNNKFTVGKSSLTIQKIEVSTQSALSFDYKCDLLDGIDDKGVSHRNYFKVFLDNNTEPAFEAYGYRQMWQKASVILTPGTHTLKFETGSDDGYCGTLLENATFLDNFTLVPDTIASVDIYPKGLQETYVKGDAIQFSAKALRSDGSVITGKTAAWSTTGGSIDATSGLFTPGSSEGTITVTASIDGLTASNQTVKVHGANYLTEPVTIGDYTFTGEITKKSGNVVTGTNNITLTSPTPVYNNFTTNGFFVIKGSVTDSAKCKGVSVFVRKQGPDALLVAYDENGNPYNTYNPDYKYQAVFYIPAGDFNQRVWLRFGDGDYDVYIEEVIETNEYEDYDGYEGSVYSWKTSNEKGTSVYYKVTNNTGLNLSAKDYAALTPSAYCQCDNFLVSNPFNAVMAELPADATIGTKFRALYDWEAHSFHYDYVSFSNNQSTKKRKKQDAVHAVKYGMAVCEGYADLYTAFARLAGQKSIYQTSQDFNHAWTEVYYKGAWKMIDITWDDPSEEGSTKKFPTSEYYDYFLIDPDDASHIQEEKTQSDRKPDISRTISATESKYYYSSYENYKCN